MYDYPNARIRGLRGRLLRPAELDALAAQPAVSDLLDALGQTDYAPDVQGAAPELGGLRLVEDALQRNLARRVQALRGFFQSAPRRQAQSRPVAAPTRASRLLDALLARYDVANLIALLRGKAARAPAESVQRALLPAGEWDRDQLAVLAQTATFAECLAQLRAWGVPYAPQLATAMSAAQRDGRLAVVELAIGRGFLEWARIQLRGRDANTALIREALALEVDVTNLLAVLRMVHRGARLEAPAIATLLLPGGSLSVDRLTTLGTATDVGELVAGLADVPLGRALRRTAGSAALRDEVVALELAAEGYLARWSQAQVFRDPLGIALPLAYHAMKVAEVRRLRLIARALEARWSRPQLRELLAAC